MVQSVITWLEENEDWVYNLPLQLSEEITTDDISDVPKRKVCITGKMDMTRKQLQEVLENKGFHVTSSVTKDCYALITGGDTSSSKYKKAISLGINVVDYWEDRGTPIITGNF